MYVVFKKNYTDFYVDILVKIYAIFPVKFMDFLTD